MGARAPQITILRKKGRRIIENSEEIFARLTAALPDCTVVMVEGEQIATMSIHDQVCALAAVCQDLALSMTGSLLAHASPLIGL